MTQWDFRADVERLLALTGQEGGQSTMSGIVEMAQSLVLRGRRDDPAGLARWFNDNAEMLVAQQILISTVHAQRSPATGLPRLLHEWAARSEIQAPHAAVEWLKEEHPALLRAWLLSRVEDLIARELAGWAS